MTPPEYTLSPGSFSAQNKRRRVSYDDDIGHAKRISQRAQKFSQQVPRPYAVDKQVSASFPIAYRNTASSQSPSFEKIYEPRTDSIPSSPSYDGHGGTLHAKSPRTYHPERTEPNAASCRLPTFSRESDVRERLPVMHHHVDHDDIEQRHRRPTLYHGGHTSDTEGYVMPQQGFHNGCHQPTTAQTRSGESSHHESAVFSPGTYRHHYLQVYSPADNYGMGTNGDTKPRKRRGNLPKEVTEILLTWFMDHLEKPYPTEEEKQILMKQTGLQMNQISNWFINARRRKLPSMLKDLEAENKVIRRGSLDILALLCNEPDDYDSPITLKEHGTKRKYST
ncbi:hypothetical protein F4808DRAFT_464601 [Astrocystis sublimbata]|nr:hypothetical protein F4808DRAFT_464601 [Astrocystis sublimbata]